MDNNKNMEIVVPEEPTRSEIHFDVKTNLEQIAEKFVLTANFEAIELWIENVVSPYANMVVTEDTENIARDICAEINKLVDRIDGKRKAIEKQWKEPLETFKKRCANLCSLCITAKNNLWTQIKAKEQKEKEEKEARYKTYYETAAQGIVEYRSWEAVRSDKFFAKSTKAKDVYEILDGRIKSIKDDLGAIYAYAERSLLPSLLLAYRQGKTLPEVIQYADELKKEMARLGIDDTRSPKQEENTRQPITEISESDTDEELCEIDMRVWGTLSQIKCLKQFLKDNKIKYGKIPE